MRSFLMPCTLWALACTTADVPVGDDARDDASEAEDDTAPVGDDTVPATGRPGDVHPWTGGLADISSALHAADALQPHQGQLPDEGPALAQTATLVVGDLDEDGVPEVIVGAGVFATAGALGHRVYRLVDGALVPDAALTAALPPMLDAVVAALDLDGDGHLDLLANHLGSAVAFGHGDGTFDAPLVLGDPGPKRDDLRVTPWDVDADGWLDLLVGGGCDVGLTMALRTGPRAFVHAPELTDEAPPAARSDGVTVIPDGDGTIVYPNGHACDLTAPHPGFYRLDARGGVPRLHPTAFGPSRLDWWSLPSFASLRSPTQVEPMGASLVDLDLDGRQDLLLSFGLPWIEAWRKEADGGWSDVSVDLGLVLDATGARALPWGVAPVDLDRDGAIDVVVSMGDDVTPRRELLQNRVFRGGPGGFVEVAALAGLDAVGSWHGVVPVDLDADGDADLGFTGSGTPPRLYRNELPGGHGLAVRLVGTTSNPLGLGATVEVAADGLPVRRHLVAPIGQQASVPEPIVFAGLGAADTADLRITWPSGQVQELTDIPAGQLYRVREPDLLVLEPPSRHVPADGRTLATLVVTPRDVAGLPRAVRSVVVTLDGDPVRVVASADRATWTATFAPRRAGSHGRVEVRVDGDEVGVRPQLWWDAP